MKPIQEYPHAGKIVFGLILFFVLFSMTPTFYEWNARGRIHADRFFELVHNFPTDYNLYLSRIREGKEGAWMATEKYTSEPHAASLSQIMYVLIGRLANFSYIQTPYVWFAYHVARVFFACVLLWAVWEVSKWAGMMFATGATGVQLFFWQVLTFLLIATSSTWPKFEVVMSVPRLGGWMGWYTMADSLQRTSFMPHVSLAQAMLVLILWVFSGGFLTRKHPGNYIFLGVVGILLGIIFPPGLLFIYGVLGFVSVVELLSLFKVFPLGPVAGFLPRPPTRGTPAGGSPSTRATHALSVIGQWFAKDMFGRIVFGVLTGPTLIYFALLLSEYPWKRLAEFDVLHPTKFSFIEYFMAVGPLLPLGIVGAILLLFVVRKKELLGKFKIFIAWIVAWLLFVFVFNYIPAQSPTRFTQMMPHVPLGILTAYLFYELIRLADRFLIGKKTQSGNPPLFIIRNSLFVIPFVVILFGFGTMTSTYMWLQDFVDHKLRATIPLVPHNAEVMYPMYDIVEGLVWLQVYTPRSAVVLSGMATGNYIPVYSGNTAYIGHANTVNLEIKTAAMENFYNRRLPEVDEMAWIKSQNISYIFYGYEERDINSGVEDLRTLYPELEQVYETKTIRIYKAP